MTITTSHFILTIKRELENLVHEHTSPLNMNVLILNLKYFNQIRTLKKSLRLTTVTRTTYSIISHFLRKKHKIALLKN